jgi:hypothetical protein
MPVTTHGHFASITLDYIYQVIKYSLSNVQSYFSTNCILALAAFVLTKSL